MDKPWPDNARDLQVTFRRSRKAVVVGLVVGTISLFAAFGIAITGSPGWVADAAGSAMSLSDRTFGALVAFAPGIPFWLCAYWCSHEVVVSLHSVRVSSPFRRNTVISDAKPVRVNRISDLKIGGLLRLCG